MVESFKPQTQLHKSLSADSELSSAYNLWHNGEYTQVAKIIKKRFPKLKSKLDQTNFNILKLLLLNKTKKTKEQTAWMSQLKSDFSTCSELYTNEGLTSHFKSILRNFNDDKGAQEILKLQLKSKNIATFTEAEQIHLWKELTLNFEFTDMYSKVNSFWKKPNEANVNFLKWLKYEMVYYLFLNKKLSENMIRKVYTEICEQFETLKSEKGFLDIFAQYSLGLNEHSKFVEEFSKTTDQDWTNVPVEDIKYDWLYSQNKVHEIWNCWYVYIKTQSQQCVFNAYERWVNITFHYFNEKGIKIDLNKIVATANARENLSSLDKPDDLINDIFQLFEYNAVNCGRNFNTYKSALLGEWMIYHNIILVGKEFNPEAMEVIYEIIGKILDKAVTKQSVIFEVSKYFIYLNNAKRDSLLKRYLTTDYSNPSVISKDNIDNFIFTTKLTKLLVGSVGTDAEQLTNTITSLISAYFHITDTITKDTKWEKGERNIADDLIIISNEYYYEYSKSAENTKLSFLILLVNYLSHEKSPYNYDISYYLLHTYNHLGWYSDTLDILKFMNLKGPQFETVSYIAFTSFINHRQGMRYLIDNADRWQNENKTNTKKTLWKMFTGRNFWSGQKWIDFLSENTNSYYMILLQFFDLVINLSNNVYLNTQNGREEESEKDYLECWTSWYVEYNKKCVDNGKEIKKNQDMFVTMHKYRYSNYTYFDGNYDSLGKNDNFKREHYLYEIDSLNKRCNCLYNLYPGYKNNYLDHCDSSAFGEYDNYNFWKMRMLSLLTLAEIKNIENINKYWEMYTKTSEENNSEIDIWLCECTTSMLSATKTVDNFIPCLDGIVNGFARFNEMITCKLNTWRKELKYSDFKWINDFIELFNTVKYFYFVPFTNIAGALVDYVTSNKREIVDHLKAKAKWNEAFKSPFVALLKDISKTMDDLSQSAHKDGYFVCDARDCLNMIKMKSPDEVNKHGEVVRYKVDEGHKNIFKEIKESAKKMEDYVKQTI